jgi:hypothetical protein
MLKHIGRLKNNKRKAIVAYRTIPGDPYSCLVVLTESLPADEHDTLIKLVESPSGQDAYELAEAMARSYLPDGRNMLTGFHTTGRLQKVKTSDIEMTPSASAVVSLDELNRIIADQRGVSLEDLSVKPSSGQPAPTKTVEPTATASINAPTVQEHVLPKQDPVTPEELATQLRSQADAMFKEAKRLRETAETLMPSKKKNKSEESV